MQTVGILVHKHDTTHSSESKSMPTNSQSHGPVRLKQKRAFYKILS